LEFFAAALAKVPLDIKQLALALMVAKGMDLTDGVLGKATGRQLTPSLRTHAG
jgi:hypothetical protein